MSVICNDFAWFRKDNHWPERPGDMLSAKPLRLESICCQALPMRNPLKIKIKHILISMQVKLMF